MISDGSEPLSPIPGWPLPQQLDTTPVLVCW